MNPICSMCGVVILRDLHDYEGDPLHSHCHRQYISDIYDGMTEVMPSKVAHYFTLSGGDRLEYRDHLRSFIADWRSLSY